MLTAKDIMHGPVLAVSPETTVQEAIDALLAHKISGLPVVDNDGQVQGIITEFALLAIAYDANVVNEPVSKHMTKDVISVAHNDPVTKVADLFIVHRIRRVLVLQAGQLAGLISRRDLLRAARMSKQCIGATARITSNRSPDESAFQAGEAARSTSGERGVVGMLSWVGDVKL